MPKTETGRRKHLQQCRRESGPHLYHLCTETDSRWAADRIFCEEAWAVPCATRVGETFWLCSWRIKANNWQVGLDKTLQKDISFCTAKNPLPCEEEAHRKWESVFASYASDRELRSRIYKELKNQTNQRTHSKKKIWTPNLRSFQKKNREFSKKKTMAKDYL